MRNIEEQEIRYAKLAEIDYIGNAEKNLIKHGISNYLKKNKESIS